MKKNVQGRTEPDPRERRIVLIVREFPRPSETFVVSKFAGLLERGWDIRIVCRRFEPGRWNLFPPLRKHPEYRKRVRAARPTRPAARAALRMPPASASLFLRNRRVAGSYVRDGGWRGFRDLYVDGRIIECRPDLVHFEFGSLAVGRIGRIARRIQCRTTVSFRGYDLNFVGLDDPEYYRDVWRHADAVHLLGRDLLEKARARGCPREVPYRLIPPGVDIDFFRPSRVRTPSPPGGKGPVRILSVGRLDWRKGYEYACGALAELQRRGIEWRWRIVGDGDFLEALAFAAHQEGVEERVEWLGGRTPEEVRSEMEQADVFLHPAVSEGFCNAVIEAQSMGLPVVAADAGGLPENIADGETGILVPRRDPRALAQALIRLANDPALGVRLGAAGRKRAQRQFSIRRNLDAFEDFYRDVFR